MITKKQPFTQLPNEFEQSFSILKMGYHLRKAGIVKGLGYSCLEVFRVIFFLIFEHKNWFRIQERKKKDLFGKDVVYRFLNNPCYSWRKFLLSLSHSVYKEMKSLTSSKRVKVFIIDDSTYNRSRSKALELLARVMDHTTGKFVKGFRMLTLGWSDGHSFIPIDFSLLSSAKAENRYQEINSQTDKRTCGFKRRQESIQSSPHVISGLLDHALQVGIEADYVLMDTWFTHAPLIEDIHQKGLFVIGMVKELKQRYCLEDQFLTLRELYESCKNKAKKEIICSVQVRLKSGLPIKVVFVQNRNKKSEWLAILSTDCSLTGEEIVRIYGYRWKIETFFKCVKSYLKLEKEFQGRSYDMLISHTTIVFARYIFLAWQSRQQSDPKTLGGMFYLLCDEIQALDFKTALKELWAFIQDVLNLGLNKETLQCQLRQWIGSLPSYIKECLGVSCCES